jgi:AraC family transcriptional regulator
MQVEWTKALKQAIDYMESNLLSDCKLEDVADYVHISPFYFQKAFKMITGYTIGEYVKNRRLYLAALDSIKTNIKVIDLAYKYGYDTPESFTKAFARFHGLSPMQIRKYPYKIKSFYPLQISISVSGGDALDYRVEFMEAFELLGVGRNFSHEDAFEKIPLFWQEWRTEIGCDSGINENEWNMGKYGISIASEGKSGGFDYFIAGDDAESINKEGLERIRIPAMTWAKFSCTGPMPEAIESLNARIYNSWLTENEEYEIDSGYNIEIYDKDNIHDSNYHSEIWIPVRKIKKSDK